MMDAKGETHGGGRRRGPTGNIDDFQDDLFTTGTTSNQNVVSTAHDYDDNNSNDDDDASDDLRLDDFIGVSEMEQNEDVLLGENSKSSSITSSSSIRRSRKLLRKKKQTTVADAASASTHPSLTLSPSSPSPVIVVEGVDAEEVEGVTLKDAGNEKGREEEVDGGDLGALMKTNDVSDVDMDFGVLEVSSHLNLDVSKQKTSLRKKGSLARRKRPTRHTVANPTAAASDSLFMDSTDGTLGMTFSSQTDLTDNVDSGKLSMFDSSSSDAVGTPKKCVPRKLPMMVPGLQDLRQSRLFNQERQKSGGGSHSAPSTTPTKATAAADSGEDPSAPEPSRTPEASSGIGGLQRNDSKSLYKQPVWLSEMKAKTSSAAPKTTRAQEATQSSLTSEEAEMDTHVEKTRAAGDDVEFVRASANLDPRTIQTVGISSTTSGSSSTVDRSTGRREEGLGLKRRGVSPGVGARTREQQQQDKPVWMRAAQEKTSRVADSLQGQKGNKQKEEEDDDTPVAPPWAAELKRKNRPLVGAGQTFGGNNRSEGAETPPKKSTESRGCFLVEREVYTPSLADRNKLNSTNNTSSSSSSLRDSGKGKATNGSAAGVRGPQGSPQPTGGIPQWKQELAERKKRRQSGQSGTAGSSDRRSSETSSNSGGGSDTTDSSSSLPAWRQQLKTRKSSLPVSERPTEEGGGSASPDWARQVQERRARLMKSGLLGDAANESQC